MPNRRHVRRRQSALAGPRLFAGRWLFTKFGDELIERERAGHRGGRHGGPALLPADRQIDRPIVEGVKRSEIAFPRHAKHVPQRDKFEALWRGVVEEGLRDGIFDCPDSGLAVRGLMGMMNWTLTWYRPGGGKSIEKIADEYAELIFHGMLK